MKFCSSPVDPRSGSIEVPIPPASGRRERFTSLALDVPDFVSLIATYRMDSLLELFRRLRDVQGLVAWGGYIGLSAIVFAETGLLVGFFLPGDSLIVTAGLLSATKGLMNVYWLGLFLTIASILGNMVGYAIGAAAGPRLFTREDSLLFNKKHLYRASAFYEKHGGKTIIIARFMPIVRTFVPVVAGIGQMQYRRYMYFNVVGGVLWIWSMLFIGYFLGRYIPGVDKHIEIVILIVIFVSLLPGIISWLRHRSQSRSEPDALAK